MSNTIYISIFNADIRPQSFLQKNTEHTIFKSFFIELIGVKDSNVQIAFSPQK
jgi:hypothetical protein